ncbi:MAG: alpha-glucan family phosphorylase [Chloroflexota bacterium]|nr:alpha-glucan family phosphorylase [Chloroflexota bacterium]
MMSNERDLVLPPRIERLGELAYNMWWSWHPKARELFRRLDYQLWRLSVHNPVRQLQQIKYYRLEEDAVDPEFIGLYDSVMADFDAYLSNSETWLSSKYPGRLNRPIAFFSAEFAIHNSLPIYAGGLGVLAGDICKEASDVGLPFIGVGFMYPHGYFHQHVSADGWQEEIYTQLNFDETPISRVLNAEGNPLVAKINLGERDVSIGVWRVNVGRAELYLLDTDIDENIPSDRSLASHLYVDDPDIRIQQEIILGIGGVRVLRLLGKEPVIWHGNEGHVAFMMIERVKEEMERGHVFDEAVKRVRSNTVFTTHTPVPAGHDVFSIQLVEKYFGSYWNQMGIDKDEFINLGKDDGAGNGKFNMTALGLRLALTRNGVSVLHRGVARRMWCGVWPDLNEDEVPILHITNGVHLPTWIAPELVRLYDKYLGEDWVRKHDDPEMWKGVWDIPDEEFWFARKALTTKLMGAMRGRAQERLVEGGIEARQLLFMGSLLHPEVLTIGFVRRFTEYKRPDILFRDLERLKRIVSDYWRPVQIIFAGKSHPNDSDAKRLLQYVYGLASDRDFQGRIAFVEDYDMHIAHYLVQGIDVWLNTPRRLREACGTSGMKAAMNGSLHLSVRDGWWHEGFNGKNGWTIGGGPEMAGAEDEDSEDADDIYRLLEDEIVPLYYERDRHGIPHGWVEKCKESISSVAPYYCGRRMLKEYTDRIYIPTAISQPYD